MALEEELKKNTAALEAMTAALEKQTELLEGGMAKASGTAAKTTAKTTAAKKPAAKKPAAKKPTNPTEEDLREKFGGFLTSVEDKPGKKRLTATVKPILEHFGAERVTEIDEENRKEAMGYADLLIAGFEEDGIDGAEAVELPFMEEDQGEEDDGDVL